MSTVRCKTCGTALPSGAMFCGECGSSVLAASAMSDTQHVEPLPMPGRHEAFTAPAKAAPRSPAAPAVFRLIFSTGENAVVAGPGLIGRNPVVREDEGRLEIVRVVDPQLSVSKTHLEFGIENGMFWVSDRHSGNGTSISVSGEESVEALPGERYGVARGTRIRIGEQYFDVL
ncbi:zinc-ribbon domain-containing protein [Agreia sp. VKM Ac-1783]|uniref:zinc-ribbon domain-containing protein n=1 Tax=Agreia sp. VKM Ac-1783 TaxID=1938889 RepID=UPI000A2AE287|nr:zinc-ribbon domain-containing protein [Agreia sp. VKM Ac-1783]SMQ68054.1 FHA domain-containing protein [Agreia sp. VKM Ac-1783]